MSIYGTFTRNLTAGVLAAAVLASAAAPVDAQQRSLRIADGEVYIDGRRVPEDELPADLRVDDVMVHYTFSGDVRPVVQLGDAFYILDGDSLRTATIDERDDSPFFGRGGLMPGFTPPDVQVSFRNERSAPRPPNHTAVFERKAEELHRQAERLQELQQHLQTQALQNVQQGVAGRLHEERLRELESLAREMSVHAVEAARVAGDLPRVELETYLQDVQQRNEALFEQLVTEQELEHRTLEMAGRIRQMADGAERRAEVDELRSRLDEIFELKQNNRRRQIEQLERRLEDLQRKLEERERLRGDIVDQRLEQLLHGDSANW